MFKSKEIRGNNSMLGRVQRQEDYAHQEKMKAFSSSTEDFGKMLKLISPTIPIPTETPREPTRTITKYELGNKRRLLR